MKTVLMAIMAILLFTGMAMATQGLPDPYPISIPSGGSTIAKTIFVSATTSGGAGNTIITAVTGKRLKIWEFAVTTQVATSVYFLSASTAITQTVKLLQYGSWTGNTTEIYGQKSPALVTAVGAGLILQQDTTGPTGVWVKYTEED